MSKIIEDDLIGVCTRYRRPINIRKAEIKLNIKGGRFEVSNLACEILKVDDGYGLMFWLSKKNKTATVKKEDKTGYILHRCGPHSRGFACKELMKDFDDTFQLLETGRNSFIFTVGETQDEKGRYSMTLAKIYKKT